jgi:hypothetical protein
MSGLVFAEAEVKVDSDAIILKVKKFALKDHQEKPEKNNNMGLSFPKPLNFFPLSAYLH